MTERRSDRNSDSAESKDRLEELVKGFGRTRLNMVLKKDVAITIRVSKSDRNSIKRAAKILGLTVTEYLLRLHSIVSHKMNEGE